MLPGLSFNRTLLTSIVLSMLVIIAMLAFSYRQTQYTNSTAGLIAHTQQELYATEKVLSGVTDNETGSRGFVITGEASYLEPLENSKKNIYKDIAALQRLTSDNPSNQKNIDSLLYYAGKRMAFSDSIVELRQKKGIDAAVKMVTSGRGKIYADKTRDIIDSMQEDANAIFQKNKAENVQAIALEKIILLGITLLILTLMVFAFWKEKQRTVQKAEKNTEEQLAFLSRQINQSNDAIYTLNAGRKIQTWNKGAENLYGFTEEEALGSDPIDLLQTDISSEEVAIALIEVTERDYWSGDLRRTTKDGRRIYVHASTTNIRNTDGKITGYVAVSHDITEQKKLYEQVNHLANIVEQSSEAIFSRDAGLRLISWNKGAENLFGYSKKEAIGKTPLELGFFKFSPEEIAAAEKQMKEKGSWKSELYFHHKDGSSFFGTVTGNVIQNEKKTDTSFYFIVKDISVRKQLEEHLKGINAELELRVQERTEEIAKSEKRYKALVENNEDIISVLDKNLVATYRSASAARITGWSNEEFASVDATEYIHPDYLQYIQEKMKQSLEKPGIPVDIKIQVKHKKGHYIWLEGIINNMLHDSSVEGIITNVRDVTQRIDAEKKVAASEKRFRALLENNYDVISLMDESFNVFYRSPSASRINGWNDEERMNRDGTAHIHPDDREYAGRIVKELMEKPGKSINTLFRSQHKDGHYLWMEGTVVNMLHDENIKAIVFNYRDVTERIEAEKKLKASEEQFRHSMDNMLEGVQIIGFDWRYIYVNNSMAKHGKYAKEELIGHTVMEKYPGIEQTEIFKVYQQCFNEREATHLENKFVFPDKTTGWFELSFLPVPEGIFILSVDITERKHAEEKIKSLNAELEEKVNIRTEQLKKSNEELEAFSYSVSHDLRAPLRAIIGYSNILEEDYGSRLDDEARRITGIIKDNTKRMGALIDDLLAFSKMSRHELRKTRIDTNEMVHGIREILDKMSTNGKIIQWTMHSLPSIQGDISTIRQVWMNLLLNAFKYSGKTAQPHIEAGSFKQDGQTVFYVKDNGVGFNEQYKHKLFKVFQRLHSADEFEGTGIGLAIVDKIVSKHGGKVWAEGQLNKGASFYFSLPES